MEVRERPRGISILYFFEGNVRSFFSIAGQSKWKPILAQIGIYAGIAAVAVITARIMN